MEQALNKQIFFFFQVSEDEKRRENSLCCVMSNADCPRFVLVVNRSIIKEEEEKAHKQGQGQRCGCLANMALEFGR